MQLSNSKNSTEMTKANIKIITGIRGFCRLYCFFHRPAPAARGVRQVRPVPAAGVAPRRHGGPDPGLGPHPRRDHGHRRRLPDRPLAPIYDETQTARTVVMRRRRAHAADRGDRRLRVRRHQEGAGLLDGQPDRLHVPRRRASARPGTSPASPTCYAHGFFKAGLFLGAGSVMHAMNDQVDMRRFGGLWKKLPITFGTFGARLPRADRIFPFLAGYWTKDAIIEAAFDRGDVWGWVLGGVGDPRRRADRLLHDPADADDLLRPAPLGGGRAPARVARR